MYCRLYVNSASDSRLEMKQLETEWNGKFYLTVPHFVAESLNYDKQNWSKYFFFFFKRRWLRRLLCDIVKSLSDCTKTRLMMWDGIWKGLIFWSNRLDIVDLKYIIQVVQNLSRSILPHSKCVVRCFWNYWVTWSSLSDFLLFNRDILYLNSFGLNAYFFFSFRWSIVEKV